ncbi:STAS domain-containing protein, partial [Streptomyces sp. NPDC007346]|uniref:STAS domain-containing protein n=1 Tax=Streptomyces sp. NPDC007346 TaxID=3154682 RepID=UPI0034528B1F
MQPPPSEDRAVSIITRQERGALVLTVSGDLDIDSVPPLSRALDEAAATGSGPVVVDLAGVGFADSTTVNVLLQGQSALGGRLRLASPSPFVQRLIGMIGLDSAIPVLEEVDQAIASAFASLMMSRREAIPCFSQT